MISSDDYIVEMLLSQGMVTEEQVEQAKERAQSDNDSSTLDCLYELNCVTEQNVVAMLGSEYGMDTYDFDKAKTRIPAEIIQQMPGDIAKRYRMVPISLNNGILRVALSDPTDLESIDSVRYLLKMEIEGVIASRQQIDSAINTYYNSMDSDVSNMLEDMTEATTDLTIGTTQDTTMDSKEQKNDEDSAPIIRLVSLIILEAFRTRASDIHMEPLEKRFRIRYRIDGVLNEVQSPPKYMQNQVISRLKLQAGMDLSEHRIPQDGRIRITALGRELDLRVSSIPTTNGESIVMRILDKSGVMLGISELGFFDDDQATIERIIHFPDGIFLVTGPTGSGKTTSLYSFLHALNQPTRKIITAEDPVEYELSGINQVQIVSEIGLTFAASLRAMLRQAPNIIMVGEIRDSETGEIAINAALTGHLVFSTLHTNDAPSAVTRLIDMGIKPFLVASSLRAVMAQRLTRRICKNCAEPYEPTDADLDRLKLTRADIEGLQFHKGKGCPDCKKGYRGRLGVYEMFILDESIERLIYEMVDSGVIRKRAQELGMRTLREDAFRKAAAGLTTLQEVLRLTVDEQG